MRTWEEMRISIAERLLRTTGHDVEWWNAKIQDQQVDNEPSLREWLNDQSVTGYQQMLLVWERFGYPDFLLATADELLDGQYHDRAALRPLLDAIVAIAATFGPLEVQARKTYTSLITPRRTFAAVRPTTKSRVDLVLRIDGVTPAGRLLDGHNAAGGGLNLKLALTSLEEFDDEAVGLLRQAYEANC